MDNNHQEKETECITPPRLSPPLLAALCSPLSSACWPINYVFSPLVGYLLAGVLAGPFTPGFVADTKLAPELAELGVILLMFGVGLHFSLKDLMAVKAIAIPGAIAQIAVATLLGMALSAVLGWSLMTGIVFGLCLSTASTVVLLRALEERQLIDSQRGKSPSVG
ncbi:putative transport protein [Escherichia coli]|uniref:Putative transport protein n=1 Tax=Escherichia coli TaxID=562 RepID=A0A376L0Q2_ECOLX|nr:putative transport protein [Escherichia coli]